MIARRMAGRSVSPWLEAARVRLAAWAAADVPHRIWAKDPTVWIPDAEAARATPELADRLGWLDAPESMQDELRDLEAFAAEIRDEGFRRIVLLGMGGSSLAPEVFMRIFGNAPGFPPLTVLDSTHPGAVRCVADELDLPRTLFIVSSKSGGTIETLSLFAFFHDAVAEVSDRPGRQFIVITDPGSKLEALAAEKSLRRVFPGVREVGGRYSALTNYGLVPAALIGVDLRAVLVTARTMRDSMGPEVPVDENSALGIGATLGELALAGRDKVTFLISDTFAPFGAWVEQLIAESTGKNGGGLVPVVHEPHRALAEYGDDRAFVYLRCERDDTVALDETMVELEERGHAVLRLDLADKSDLGGEFFRWEMATAAAGAVLGINPFDQPNVEAAKARARELMAVYRERGALPEEEPTLVEAEIALYADAAGADMRETAARFLAQARKGDYVALMAYLPPSTDSDLALNDIRAALGRRCGLATTCGYGPRFLHSTGQLHKGDGNHGLFIQITQSTGDDVPVPGEPYTFGGVIAAQAAGDRQALLDNGRRMLRFHLAGDLAAGLERLRGIVAG